MSYSGAFSPSVGRASVGSLVSLVSAWAAVRSLEPASPAPVSPVGSASEDVQSVWLDVSSRIASLHVQWSSIPGYLSVTA